MCPFKLGDYIVGKPTNDELTTNRNALMRVTFVGTSYIEVRLIEHKTQKGNVGRKYYLYKEDWSSYDKLNISKSKKVSV